MVNWTYTQPVVAEVLRRTVRKAEHRAYFHAFDFAGLDAAASLPWACEVADGRGAETRSNTMSSPKDYARRSVAP